VSSGHPRAVTVTLEGSGEQFRQIGDDTVLRAALRAGIGFPYECNAGGCGSCRMQVVDGESFDLWPDAPGRTERDRRNGRILACQTRLTTDATIRVRTGTEHVAHPPPVRRRATVAAIADITHDMRSIVLRTDGAAEFLPGQYLSLHLPTVDAPRNYSMANTANDEGLWELIVRRVPGGQMTAALFGSLAQGSHVEIDGPYGLDTLRPDAPRDIACVAGGSGLAPMLSIARGAVYSGLLQRRRLHFFYGARTPADVCGRAELEELPGFGTQLLFTPVVSLAPDEHGLPWDGATGFVHEAALAAMADHLAETEWYCAGPPPMTQALQTALVVDHLVPVGQVHFDRFF
jgi:toluene monooxygenase electron transfer component